jgi:hypothetical protein
MDMELPALIADGYTVFDGVLPTFDRATVEQITDALAYARIGDMPGEHPYIRWSQASVSPGSPSCADSAAGPGPA